ncbi:uncharacterized protein C15orf65 homolog isoform X5 [Mauremys reevesii]|uniref:uncharacterized protein C15orf65 homolog isoform X5 n=1 Tax=Mauremys reevesii TaxID=260615 RepID=UPI00193F1B2F|nr:uncharacterized protein C15orf65 homolog isoform X5 [Mauremys reevesii]
MRKSNLFNCLPVQILAILCFPASQYFIQRKQMTILETVMDHSSSMILRNTLLLELLHPFDGVSDHFWLQKIPWHYSRDKGNSSKT